MYKEDVDISWRMRLLGGNVFMSLKPLRIMKRNGGFEPRRSFGSGMPDAVNFQNSQNFIHIKTKG